MQLATCGSSPTVLCQILGTSPLMPTKEIWQSNFKNPRAPAIKLVHAIMQKCEKELDVAIASEVDTHTSTEAHAIPPRDAAELKEVLVFPATEKRTEFGVELLLCDALSIEPKMKHIWKIQDLLADDSTPETWRPKLIAIATLVAAIRSRTWCPVAVVGTWGVGGSG